MVNLLVKVKVKDYFKWRPVFDENSAFRKTSGSRGGRLFRNADNPNEILIIYEWDSLDRARKFAQSDDLKKAMQRAGVIDKPDIYFLEEGERVPA